MKNIIALILCAVLVFVFSSCSKTDEAEDETGTVVFESPQEAYEAMTGAAISGDFSDALRYYESGAEDATDPELSNWYNYAKSANDYDAKGCIGYPLDFLMNRVSVQFDGSKALMGELQTMVHDLNGCYAMGDVYLYLQDGKIAVGEATRLVDKNYAPWELVIKDNVLYWAKHNMDGADELLYTIERSDTGLTVTAVEGVENDIYAGNYSYSPAEQPILYY